MSGRFDGGKLAEDLRALVSDAETLLRATTNVAGDADLPERAQATLREMRARLSELERVRRGRISALAQAQGLLNGSASADEVLALAGEAAVPRLVPWCAVLLPADGARLRTVYARHMDEEQSAALASLLDRAGETMAGAGLPLRPAAPARPGPGWPWPLTAPGLTQAPAGALAAETAWCFPLGTADGAGVLAVGHLRDERLPREVAELAADLACRIGMALDNARLRVPG